MKKISTLVGIVIIIVAAAIIFGGVFAYQYLTTKAQSVIQTQQNNQTNSWKIYKNDKYGFELKYPNSFIIGQNEFSTNFGLVICPRAKTQENPNGLISCGIKSALKGEYEDGIIYLFTYNDNNIQNKDQYYYLGKNPSDNKYYYLYVALDKFPEYNSIVNGITTSFKFINPSITTTSTNQPSITISSPTGDQTWQIGTTQTIKYTISSNMPRAATCVDVYAVDYNSNKTPLSVGSYISIAQGEGLNFQLGINNSENIVPGVYKLELYVHSCAKTNNTFITSTTGNGFITVTANPNFVKPTITQISPSQGGENDVITISGDNLSGINGIQFSPTGRSPADTGWTAYSNIISKSQNSVTFGFTNVHGELPAGTYQVNVMSPTGNSNLLNFTFSGQ